MLRILYAQTDASQGDGKGEGPQEGVTQRWTLCGQLAGPWVDEVRACVEQHRRSAEKAHIVLDLRDVTFIDENGEQLLLNLKASGAEFVAAGVETQHLLENLQAPGERPLCKFSARALLNYCKPGTGTRKETK